jgi:hypothetical protein
LKKKEGHVFYKMLPHGISPASQDEMNTFHELDKSCWAPFHRHVPISTL